MESRVGVLEGVGMMGLWEVRRWSRHQSRGFKFRLFPFLIGRPWAGRRDAVSSYLAGLL